jgi:hypothetical protein
MGNLQAMENTLALVHFAEGTKGDEYVKKMRGRILGQTVNQYLRAGAVKRSSQCRDFLKR